MKPLAVYVHIPFCVSVCGYCDFNTYAGMDEFKGVYTEAVLAEVQAWASVFEGRTVTSIAFGGGTPGELPVKQIVSIIEAVRMAAPLDPGAEISLEANPGTTSGKTFCALAQAGVNRVSLGAQSFDADELVFLDRVHSPEASASSLVLAREAGITSVNLDLMYGLPKQTLDDWESTVAQALSLAPDHLSMYALTIEPGTPLASRAEKGKVVPADPDLVADMYEMGGDRAEESGLAAYELSNWARPGHKSRHNQMYWTYGEYIGIGAGAHGFVAGERFENIAHPRAYIEAVGRSGRAIERTYTPPYEMAILDWIGLHLRLVKGFAPEEFEAEFGETLDQVVGEPLRECVSSGLIEREANFLRISRRGRLLHSEIVVRVLAHLNQQATVSST